MNFIESESIKFLDVEINNSLERLVLKRKKDLIYEALINYGAKKGFILKIDGSKVDSDSSLEDILKKNKTHYNGELLYEKSKYYEEYVKKVEDIVENKKEKIIKEIDNIILEFKKNIKKLLKNSYLTNYKNCNSEILSSSNKKAKYPINFDNFNSNFKRENSNIE